LEVIGTPNPELRTLDRVFIACIARQPSSSRHRTLPPFGGVYGIGGSSGWQAGLCWGAFSSGLLKKASQIGRREFERRGVAFSPAQPRAVGTALFPCGV